MTVEEIRSAISSDEQLMALIPDTQAIAAELSTRDTHKVPFEIGIGMILNTIGLDAGNALLDAIQSTPGFRHVYPLLEQGRLDLSSPLVDEALGSLVSAEVITMDEKLALINLCLRPVEVPEGDVKRAIWADNGERLL